MSCCSRALSLPWGLHLQSTSHHQTNNCRSAPPWELCQKRWKGARSYHELCLRLSEGCYLGLGCGAEENHCQGARSCNENCSAKDWPQQAALRGRSRDKELLMRCPWQILLRCVAVCLRALLDVLHHCRCVGRGLC